MKSRILSLLLPMLAGLFTGSSVVRAQSTSFTYQGQLTDSGNPANGNYGMLFNLCQSPIPGSGQIGTVAIPSVPVSKGLFTVSLDFGAAAFSGTNLWLEVDVQTNGGYAVLLPRQAITAAPYAIMANAASNLVGALPASQLSGTLPANLFSGGYGSAVMFSNTSNSFVGSFTGNGAGLTNLNASQLTGALPSSALPGLIALLNTNQTFTGTNVFNGRIGINTGSPNSQMELVANANGEGIRVTGSSSAPYSPAYFLFDGPNERAAFALAENSGAYGSSAVPGDIVIRADAGNLLLQSGIGAAALTVNTVNNVGIGYAGYNNQRLAVNGGFYVDGAAMATGGFQVASDARFKTNVATLHAALDTVLKLRGVSYDWKRAEYANKNFPSGEQIGFIAQEVEKVLPQLVQKGQDGSLTLNYQGVIPVLVEAVKDQQKVINQKEARISTLETRLADLQKIVNRLAEKESVASR